MTSDFSAKPVDLTFEDSVRRLEQIVVQLDSGQSDLQTSLAQYEEGIRLLRNCRQILDGAKRRIAILRDVDENGRPILETATEESFQSDESTPGRQNKTPDLSTKMRTPRKKIAPSPPPEAEDDPLSEEYPRNQGLFSFLDDPNQESV